MDIRSKYYGRKTARSMRPEAQGLYEEFYPVYSFTAAGQPRESEDNVILEIGFGMGDFLAHQALMFPDKLFIGVEPFKTGIVSLLKKIKQHNIENIRIHHGVIYDIVGQLPLLDSAYILYPDPWPKKRHNKRRVVQCDLIAKLAQRLMPNGKLNIASDHADYQIWIKNVIMDACLRGSIDFDLSKMHKPFDNWIPTKYEKKALKEGRTPMYFHGKKSKQHG